MKEVIIIFVCILVLVTLALIFHENGGSALFLFVGVFLVFGFARVMRYDKEPKAIDVYRGKTELKINEEIIDSVVVSRDTIVVFKDIEYGN